MRKRLRDFLAWFDARARLATTEAEVRDMQRELVRVIDDRNQWKRTALEYKALAGTAIVELTLAKTQLASRDVMLDESERRASLFESIARRRSAHLEVLA